jgi:hypothetical protein
MRNFGHRSVSQLGLSTNSALTKPMVDKHTSMFFAVFVRIRDFLATLFQQFFCQSTITEYQSKLATSASRDDVRRAWGVRMTPDARRQ